MIYTFANEKYKITPMTISLIAAVANNNVIGKDNQLIWHLPADLKHFKRITMGHVVVMGRKTYESMMKPLPGRVNVIITRNENYHVEGVIIATSLNAALKDMNVEEVFIIGGGEIFKQGMALANKIYLTQIHADFEGDTFFPEINPHEWIIIQEEKHLKDEKNHYDYTYITYQRK
jgi:dihydrofolate reductase